MTQNTLKLEDLLNSPKTISKVFKKDADILPEYYRRIENVADVLRDLTTKKYA